MGNNKIKPQYGFLAAIVICAIVIIGILLTMSQRGNEQATVSANNSNQQKLCSHIWSKSTCTEPQKCTVCGVENGNPRGHQWEDATCISPKKCRICGETQGQKLAHSWKEATSTSPKTCSRCGTKEGSIKTYSGGDYGTMSQEWVSFNKWDVHPYLMSVKTENCVSFTLTLHLWAIEYGSPYGTWEVYCKDGNGNWEHVKDIDVQQNTMTVEIDLPYPMTFTEVAVNRVSTKGCEHKYEINVTGYSIYVE